MTRRVRRRLATGLLLAPVLACVLGAGEVLVRTSAPPPARYGESAPRPRPEGTVRIATWNVLNLFDHDDDPALAGRFDDATLGATDERCRNLAAVIRRLDADVLALQEVESRACLEWFRDTYLDGLGYDHVASEDVGYARGVECSVLSRFPLEAPRVWPNESLADVVREGPGFTPVPRDAPEAVTYQRSPLAVVVRLPDGTRLDLWTLHHKSGRSFSWMREAEALRTTRKLRGSAPDAIDGRIVLGDFNAAPWDKSVRLYLEAGLVDADGARALGPTPGTDEAEARLGVTHESGRVIDYVLLDARAHARMVPGSAFVWGQPYDPDYDWREDPRPSWYASDHYPVAVDLRLEPRDG